MPTDAAPRPDKPTDSGADRLRNFAKYSGLGFQMLATIGLCAWGGLKLDAHFQNKNPWYTIGLMVLGLVAATYQVIRTLTRNE
ncbi:AtpZ/AtpI family protein [Hymenobacter sp. BT175]|uniref:AtpZ/AtpI family protein n=1 Tax=Hymenobacter translucens TaxID=2886507 RepID=UPI001D0DEABF|nr:AtpZ/AtpI family protein [Hymenobacter translucens]MCC2546038.1 AtpZ/AtpI family protein [Hymenobacter translucens]